MDVLHKMDEQGFKRVYVVHAVAQRVHGQRLCHGRIDGICNKIHVRFHASEAKSVGRQRRGRC